MKDYAYQANAFIGSQQSLANLQGAVNYQPSAQQAWHQPIDLQNAFRPPTKAPTLTENHNEIMARMELIEIRSRKDLQP